MTPVQTLAGITSLAFPAVDTALQEVQPQTIIVHGDTTRAMVGSMCGFYRQLRVGHVEAGLRTRNIYSPFPELVNRSIIGKVAALNFAPTQRSADNLLRNKSVHVTSNTVVDAL